MAGRAVRNSMIETRPLAGAIGVEVQGVDLAGPIDEASFAEIRQCLLDHCILLWRGQGALTPAQHVAFTARFGPVMEHPLKSRKGLDDYPDILVLENKPGRPGARNDFWHSDISFAETPPLGSILKALTVPEGYGDTMFANMYAAYDGLSAGLKATLDSLFALHSGEALQRRNAESPSDGQPITAVPPPARHPVVRTNPESGRKALFVNPWFTTRIDGWTADESAGLLHHLYAEATRPENIYRHRWQAGDVLMWDNRSAMHYAVLDYDETMPRLMHRTTAKGDRPS